MRVLILTFGTQGDVVPYLALADGLLASGHEAAVCTAEGIQELITEAGVPYEHMGNDMLRDRAVGDAWNGRTRRGDALARRSVVEVRVLPDDGEVAHDRSEVPGGRRQAVVGRRLPNRL